MVSTALLYHMPLILEVLCVFKIRYEVRFASLLYETFIRKNCGRDLKEHINTI